MGDRRDRIEAQKARETEIELRQSLGDIVPEPEDDEPDEFVDEEC